MRTGIRISAFLVALAAVFGASWAVGDGVTPPRAVAATPSPVVDAQAPGPSAHGWTLLPVTTGLAPGQPGEYAFSLDGPGAPESVRVFVVRRDSAEFQALAPQPGADGVWRAALTLPSGGGYRVVAVVAPTAGAPVTLTADLSAGDGPEPVGFPLSRVAQVDGYQVRLDGELHVGALSRVYATVSRDGEAVTGLEPYAGGFGSLVALLPQDLTTVLAGSDAPAPAPNARSGPGIAFTARLPSAGTYRLYLQFRHAGVVRTVDFTVATPAS